MYLRVNSNIYLILYFINLGIGLIKKASKNQIELQPEFYDFFLSKKNNINELEENIDNNKNLLALSKLDDEINYVNYLINLMKTKLLSHQCHDIQSDDINNFIIHNGKKINIPYKELLQLNNNKTNIGLLAAKSESGLKVESAYINDPKNIIDQKKLDMSFGKLQYNEEYLNLCSFANRLYLTSNNNNKINLTTIESKNNKHIKEKEEISNFHIPNENENLLNNNNYFVNNNNINENKCDINFGIFKTNHIDNKNRKDSIVSDFSFNGNLNIFNSELNNLFN